MKMLRSFFLVSAVLLSGCSVTADQYQPSVATQQVIRNYDRKVNVGTFTATKSDRKVLCRLANNVDLPDRHSFESYIENAFKEELVLAGMYSNESDITISGHLHDTDVSSGVTDAHWTFDVTVANNRNETLRLTHKREYNSSFVGGVACGHNMPKSLMPTVQELIREIVSHPKFESMISSSLTASAQP